MVYFVNNRNGTKIVIPISSTYIMLYQIKLFFFSQLTFFVLCFFLWLSLKCWFKIIQCNFPMCVHNIMYSLQKITFVYLNRLFFHSNIFGKKTRGNLLNISQYKKIGKKRYLLYSSGGTTDVYLVSVYRGGHSTCRSALENFLYFCTLKCIKKKKK